jgi:hypothetical protein
MSLSSMDGLTAAIIGTPTWWGKAAMTAAAAGTPCTPWYVAGVVGAGAAPTGGLNGATFTGPSLAGQIGMPAAVSGAKSVLLRASLTEAAGVGGVWLVDRQWGNVPVVTTTTAQAITSPTWVARDSSASTSGNGVFLALECSAANTNGAPITNTTVSYTNSSGTAGRTATLASWPANAPQGTFIPLQLQAGDVGVQSVQSITLGTSYVTGQCNLIAFRMVTDLPPGPTANITNFLSFTQLGKPFVWDASVLQLVYMPTATAVGATFGSFTYAQG